MRYARFSRRHFLGMMAGAAAVSLVPRGVEAAGSAILPRKDGDPAYLARIRAKHPTKFRILQVTDLHFFSGEGKLRGFQNPRTIEILEGLVKKTKPDLVMATGDLWPGNDENQGEGWMRQVIGYFEALGVPWAFVWGNHDELSDYRKGHEAFAAAKNSLYRGAESDGNYIVDVVGRHDRSLCQLVCLNSHGTGLQPKEQRWVRDTAAALKPFGDPPPLRLAFFHIPVKQYEDIWNNKAASGVMGETVCLEKDDGSALPALKAAGIKACFCGHDHRNDYAGVADGVELVYGRATGAGGYGAEVLRKGGKLITVNCKKGTYGWETVFPDGTTWVPKPGERVERLKK